MDLSGNNSQIPNLSRNTSKKLLKHINNDFAIQPSSISSSFPIVTLILESIEPNEKSHVIKTIDLFDGTPVKIGRQVNSKTAPSLGNGYFDSKVLSRNHAEIWYDGGKIYIKDTKSSNGTFVNQKRLSEENQESAPHELGYGDIVEFGIDIMNDDGATVMYKRVKTLVSIVKAELGQVASKMDSPSTKFKYDEKTIIRDFKGETRNNAQNSESRLSSSLRKSELHTLMDNLQGQVNKAKQTNQEISTLNANMNSIQNVVSSIISNTPAPSSLLPPADLIQQINSLTSELKEYKERVESLNLVAEENKQLKEETKIIQEKVKYLESTTQKLRSELHSVETVNAKSPPKSVAAQMDVFRTENEQLRTQCHEMKALVESFQKDIVKFNGERKVEKEPRLGLNEGEKKSFQPSGDATATTKNSGQEYSNEANQKNQEPEKSPIDSSIANKKTSKHARKQPAKAKGSRFFMLMKLLLLVVILSSTLTYLIINTSFTVHLRQTTGIDIDPSSVGATLSETLSSFGIKGLQFDLPREKGKASTEFVGSSKKDSLKTKEKATHIEL